MLVYTIFDHPSDYPDHYVVRQFYFTKEGPQPGFAFICQTLEEARALVPLGGTLLSPERDDDPCIVETWM